MKTGEWRMQVDAPNFIVVRKPMTHGRRKNPPSSCVVKRDNSPGAVDQGGEPVQGGKNAEARTEYLTVLAAHPELTAINRAIAFTYGREKNHPEALKYLDLALDREPQRRDAAAARGGQRDGGVAIIRGRWPISRGSTTATLSDPTMRRTRR